MKIMIIKKCSVLILIQFMVIELTFFDFSPSVIFNQIDRENRIFFGRALHTTRTTATVTGIMCQ